MTDNINWKLADINYDDKIKPYLYKNDDKHDFLNDKIHDIDIYEKKYNKFNNNKNNIFLENIENIDNYIKILFFLIKELKKIITTYKFENIKEVIDDIIFKLETKFESNIEELFNINSLNNIFNIYEFDDIITIFKDIYIDKNNMKGGIIKGGNIDKLLYIRFIILLIYTLNLKIKINIKDELSKNFLINNMQDIISPIISTCITGISFLNLSYIYYSNDIYKYNKYIINIIKYYIEDNNIPTDINYNILFLTHKDLKIKKENKYNINSFNNTLLNDYFYNTSNITINDIVENNDIIKDINKKQKINYELLFFSKNDIHKENNSDFYKYDENIPMIIAIQKGSNLDNILRISGNMFWMYLRKIFNEFLESDNYNEMINEDYVYSLLDLKFLNQTYKTLSKLKEKENDKYYFEKDNIYYKKKENIICYVNPSSQQINMVGGKIIVNDDNTINSKLLKIKFYIGYLIMLNPFLTSLNIHNILQKLINIIYKDESVIDKNVKSFKYIEDLGLINFCNNIGKYYINHLSYINN